VENGHTVPALETLEKVSRALEIQMYQLFLEEGDQPPTELSNSHRDWASRGKGQRLFNRLRSSIAKVSPRDRTLLYFTAAKMVRQKKSARD
jgi:hypothetical protein